METTLLEELNLMSVPGLRTLLSVRTMLVKFANVASLEPPFASLVKEESFFALLWKLVITLGHGSPAQTNFS